jgi:hypothetical protein
MSTNGEAILKDAGGLESGRRTGSKFFISYKHVEPDKTLAQTFAKELGKLGHEVFIDTGIKLGTDWSSEIGRRIKWCDFLIVLVSESILNSEAVQTEIRYGHERLKCEGSPKILPVRIRYSGPLDYDLSISLDRIQFTFWETDEDTKRILNEFLAVASAEETGRTDASQPPILDTVINMKEKESGEVSQPQPTADLRPFSAPGGTMRVHDPFYMKRRVDDAVLQCAAETGQTLVIKAPYQLGKSSLLQRYLAKCDELGKKCALLDCSRFSNVEIENYAALLSGIAAFLVRTFRIKVTEAPRIVNQQELTNFIEDVILSVISEPLVIAFDEVDRVLGTSYQRDFFTMLRWWHNKRAELSSPWDRMDLALVISTEPYLLIDSADRSPFNVADPIRLVPFGREEYVKLNGLYGGLLTAAQIEQLYELLGGHPFLTRLAFHKLVSPDPIRMVDIIKEGPEIDGPFSDHLRAWLLKLSNQPGLLDGLRQIIQYGSADEDVFYRLYSCGLVRRKQGRMRTSNVLYHRFFNRVLWK